MISFVAIVSGKEYIQVLLKPSATQIDELIPHFEKTDELAIEQIPELIVKEMQEKYDLKVRVLTIEPFQLADENSSEIKELNYAGFVSVQHNEDKLEELNFQWVHPRFAMKKFNEVGNAELLEEILNWASSHDFNIEMLANNLDKLG